jgi:hypothetical protein
MGEVRNACNFSVGGCKEKRPFGRYRQWWKDIKIYFKEIRCESMPGSMWPVLELGGGSCLQM